MRIEDSQMDKLLVTPTILKNYLIGPLAKAKGPQSDPRLLKPALTIF